MWPGLNLGPLELETCMLTTIPNCHCIILFDYLTLLTFKEYNYQKKNLDVAGIEPGSSSMWIRRSTTTLLRICMEMIWNKGIFKNDTLSYLRCLNQARCSKIFGNFKFFQNLNRILGYCPQFYSHFDKNFQFHKSFTISLGFEP